MRLPFTLKSRNRKLVVLLLLLLGLGMVLHVTLNLVFKNFLERNAIVSSYFDYKKADINIFLRKIEFTDLRTTKPLPVKNRGVDLHIEKIQLSGISLWGLLVQKKLQAQNLVLTTPVISCFTGIKVDSIQKPSTRGSGATLNLSIARLHLSKGKILSLNSKKGDTLLQAHNILLNLEEVHLKKRDSGKVRFTFTKHFLSLNHFFSTLNDYDVLRVKKIVSEPATTTLTDLSIQTKYSREKLSQVTPVARDHIDFNVPEIQLFGLYEEGIEKSMVQPDSVYLKQPVLKMYCDKRFLPANSSYKPPYTETLRKMKLGLAIPKINIDSGYVSYMERVQEEMEPHQLVFDALKGQIRNLNNRARAPLTVNAHSQLMGETMFEVEWVFEAPAQTDAFVTRGRLYNFDPTSLNPFLRTTLFVTMEGYIDELYFTIAGNKQIARGDVKMKYEELEVKLLQKNLRKPNKILTWVGQLLAKEESKTSPDGYRYGTMEMEADSTKSFFNYQWNTLKDGLLHTVIGDGKKD